MRRLLLLSVAAAALVVLAPTARSKEKLVYLPPSTTTTAQSQDKDGAVGDEMRLKNAFQDTDSKSIVKFLNTRARGAAGAKELDDLIAKLDDKDAAVRNKACGELVAIGAPAVPKVRLVARDPDAGDTALLARKILKVLEDEPGNVTGAAVRLLAARRPEGTAEALLAYLPHSENESVMDDIKAALAGVAHVKGKPDPAMLKALSDPHPLRRANAITALCAGGSAEPRATLRKLLTDKSASVRLRAALALAQASDAKAISTLIALLADLPAEQGREVEQFLTDLAGDQSPKVALGSDDLSRQKARDAWAKWWLDSEGPNLVKELEKRTLTEELTTKAQGLIEKLGDDSFDVRQGAENDLKKMGAMIMPMLRTALKNPDLEIRNRSGKILSVLEMDKTVPLSPVVARLIAIRKPKGAAEAILAYLPFADDESIVDELQTALNAVTFVNGKANPAVIKMLGDKMPARRAAAATALCSGPLADYMDDIRKALKDKDSGVKLKVALALAGAREPEAVPTLISLVSELPADQASSAEDYLFRLARDSGPKDLPEGEDKKKDRAEAWKKWWDDNKNKVAMVDKFTAEVRQRYMGYVLLIQQNNNQIVELDKDNKPRVTMTGLLSPWDAQWVSNNRLLVAEYNGMRVTERNLKGEVVWEKKLDFYPMQCERLRNGHTFIVGQNKLLQVDRGGREILKIDRPHDVRTARRLPNGQIVLLTSNNQLIRMDRNGKETKNVRLPAVYYYQNEILDNGNVIVPLGWNNQIKEYNVDGKEVWSITSQQPMHAFRLPNKNTLISSQNWPYKFFEVDKAGKEVRNHVTNTYVFRVKGR